MKAYVFIKTELGQAMTVVEELRQIGSIKEAYGITGPYDAIAVVEAPNPTEIATMVMSRIQKIKGVKDTMTCFALGD
ncbi:MAG: Lrp/AsnC ligand binding domain-containing protein [Caldiserica bacterium]|jgi:DNA-binding Lrp family transcriptional regulator|nr:Lrp/AsnC ligand binding domain-containing protein [Caldisericota bacterium]MDH7562719.1 Lrp/AsnC ligand binding domain-containing protein [Caldisericota bacterium]